MGKEQHYRYIVVGGGLAGANAVEGIRETDARGSLALIGDEPHLPYHRPPVSKGILLGTKDPGAIAVKGEDFYAAQEVALHRSTRVRALDAAGRSLTLGDGRVLTWDRLLLATGSRARRLPLPGADRPGVLTIRTLDDALGLLQAMDSAGHAVVIGGSYIGAEAASALAQRGIRTTMLFPESRLLAQLSDGAFGAYLFDLFARHDVRILSGKRPSAFEGAERLETVVTDTGEEIPADLAVMGVGAALNNELAVQAGLRMAEDGGVWADARLQTSREGIFVAGDLAEYPDPTFGRRLRLEHWEAALLQGQAAGRNMAGADRPYDGLPHYFTTLFDCGFSVWGDFSRWDRALPNGAFGATGDSVFYLEGDRLCGVLQFEPVEQEEAHAIEALVRQRPAREKVEALARSGQKSIQAYLQERAARPAT